MSRTLPLHTCSICGKTTFCHCCGDHFECQECFTESRPDFKEYSPRVEDHCRTGQASKKGYLKWIKQYKNNKIKC